MKIRHVRSFLLSYPLAEPRKLAYFGGERTIRKRDAMLIRIETDCGLTGWAPGPPSEATHWLIEKQVAPFLEGRSLADPDALRVQFLKALGGDPVLVRAYCAVEIGLYDLVGKVRGGAGFRTAGRAGAGSHPAVCLRRAPPAGGGDGGRSGGHP